MEKLENNIAHLNLIHRAIDKYRGKSIGPFEDCAPYYICYRILHNRECYLCERPNGGLILLATLNGTFDRVYVYGDLYGYKLPKGVEVYDSQGSLIKRYDTIVNIKKVLTLNGHVYRGLRGNLKRFERSYPDWIVGQLYKESKEGLLDILRVWQSSQGLKYGELASIEKEMNLINNFLDKPEWVRFYGLFINNELTTFLTTARQGSKPYESILAVKSKIGNIHMLYMEVFKLMKEEGTIAVNLESADQSGGIKHFKEELSLDRIPVFYYVT